MLNVKDEINKLLTEYDQKKGWRKWFSWFPWLGAHADIRALRVLHDEIIDGTPPTHGQWTQLLTLLRDRNDDTSSLSYKLLTAFQKIFFDETKPLQNKSDNDINLKALDFYRQAYNGTLTRRDAAPARNTVPNNVSSISTTRSPQQNHPKPSPNISNPQSRPRAPLHEFLADTLPSMFNLPASRSDDLKKLGTIQIGRIEAIAELIPAQLRTEAVYLDLIKISEIKNENRYLVDDVKLIIVTLNNSNLLTADILKAVLAQTELYYFKQAIGSLFAKKLLNQHNLEKIIASKSPVNLAAAIVLLDDYALSQDTYLEQLIKSNVRLENAREGLKKLNPALRNKENVLLIFSAKNHGMGEIINLLAPLQLLSDEIRKLLANFTYSYLLSPIFAQLRAANLLSEKVCTDLLKIDTEHYYFLEAITKKIKELSKLNELTAENVELLIAGKFLLPQALKLLSKLKLSREIYLNAMLECKGRYGYGLEDAENAFDKLAPALRSDPKNVLPLFSHEHTDCVAASLNFLADADILEADRARVLEMKYGMEDAAHLFCILAKANLLTDEVKNKVTSHTHLYNLLRVIILLEKTGALKTDYIEAILDTTRGNAIISAITNLDPYITNENVAALCTHTHPQHLSTLLRKLTKANLLTDENRTAWHSLPKEIFENTALMYTLLNGWSKNYLRNFYVLDGCDTQIHLTQEINDTLLQTANRSDMNIAERIRCMIGYLMELLTIAKPRVEEAVRDESSQTKGNSSTIAAQGLYGREISPPPSPTWGYNNDLDDDRLLTDTY